MKTPNDLTEEQWKVLGLYTKIEKGKENFQTLPNQNKPLFVNAVINPDLHDSKIEFRITIWQCNIFHGDGNIVGGNRFFVGNKKMIHVFDFLYDLAMQERFDSNPNMIDALLMCLEKIK